MCRRLFPGLPKIHSPHGALFDGKVGRCSTHCSESPFPLSAQSDRTLGQSSTVSNKKGPIFPFPVKTHLLHTLLQETPPTAHKQTRNTDANKTNNPITTKMTVLHPIIPPQNILSPPEIAVCSVDNTDTAFLFFWGSIPLNTHIHTWT